MKPDAKYIGTQDGYKDKSSIPLFNITKAGHEKAPHLRIGSTVSLNTLIKNGLNLPEYKKE